MVEKLKPELIFFKVTNVEIKSSCEGAQRISSNLELKFQLVNQATEKFVHQSAKEAQNKAWRIYPETGQDIFILKTLSSDLTELGSANINFNQNFPIKQSISIPENGEDIINFDIEIFIKEINEDSWDIIADDLEASNISCLHAEECKTGLNLKVEEKVYCDENSMDQNIIEEIAKRDNNEFDPNPQIIEESKLSLLEEEKSEALKLASLDKQLPIDQSSECKNSFAQEIINDNLKLKIQEGFKKHEIENIEQLNKKIKDCEKFICLWSKKRNSEKAKEQQEILVELKKLLDDFNELPINHEAFTKETFDLDNEQSEAIIEEKLKLGLEKYKIENFEVLFDLIKETRADIESLKDLREYSLANEEENKLEELEHLSSLYNRLVSIKTMKDRENSNIQSKITSLDNLYEGTASMPESLEKILSRILCHIYLKSFNFEIPGFLMEKISQLNIVQELENLNKHERNLDRNMDQGITDKLKKYIKDQNWETAIQLLKKSIKDLYPVNFKELFRLIKWSNNATANLENKDVILLIGSTGCGKSTTVHFLAGSKMIKIKENGIEHIVPIILEDEVLKKVKVSNLNESETKHITAIQVQTEPDVYVCDTPGLMDTAGAEVDIANTRGIVNAIQKCKSVRPLIILTSNYFC